MENLRKVWDVETDLLAKLLDVCNKLGVRCWVADGTLLGAVRHKGFIPWDNDIDVCMFRSDYNILMEKGPTMFEYPYFLQTPYTDKNYYHGHCQLRNSDTAAIRPSDSYRPFNQGIFIDIFPLDAVPEDADQLRYVLRSVRKTTRFLKTKDTPILISGRIGLIFRKLRCKFAVMRKGWVSIYREGVDNVLGETKLEDCRYVAELGFSGSNYLLDKHIFDDTVLLDFEQLKVPAPIGYDAYLKTQYGDNYMTPIKVATAHDDAVFDTEKSYVDLLPMVRKLYRKKQLKKLFGIR